MNKFQIILRPVGWPVYGRTNQHSNKGDKTNSVKAYSLTPLNISKIKKRRKKRKVRILDDCFNVALREGKKNGAKIKQGLIWMNNTIK